MSDQVNDRGDEAKASAMRGEGEGTSANDVLEFPVTDTSALEGELADVKERLLRALAETENVRRQKEREVDEARKYAVTGFARGLLDVADNLSRALASVPAGAREKDELLNNLALGIELTERSLLALFDKYQVKKVLPERGERFDHNRHQAMFEVPTAELPTGTVAEVLQPGYVLADRLLRPAMVGVAKAPPANENERPVRPGAAVDTTV